ncbi:MAG TPA: alpha-L-fucosidase [Clostridia bacterium]|jgi:alpha-L-fucosidase
MSRFENSKWFRELRFGMFIHWGLYAIAARGEWIKSIERIPDQEYDKYLDMFDPVDFDARAWAKCAVDAGMKYAVLTAKHHDGFCLFDSQYTDYKVTNTKLKKDVVREFLDAFREQGLKVGLYYSLLDWHHEHYPAYDDPFHPMRGNPDYKTPRDFSKYLEYMHSQVKELVTNYGKLDILWLDFSYGACQGEYWKATELVKMIRSYQPDILINSRLDAAGDNLGSILSDSPAYYCGDFACPEQLMPPKPIINSAGEEVPWEICATINESWGYNASDKNYKSAELLIKKLTEAVSKGGNMILNVGPDAKGNIPRESIEVLQKIGQWLKRYGESIYGCGNSGLPKPEWGRYTKKDNIIYAHIYERPIGPLVLPSIDKKDVVKISLLKDFSEIKIMTEWVAANYPEYTFADIAPSKYDDITVLKIELREGGE